MTYTEILKETIKAKYGSIRQFAIQNDIPVTTMERILTSDKCLMRTSLENVRVICRDLGVSIDELCDIRPDAIIATGDESKIIRAYRRSPDLKSAFDKLARE